jgi:cbb3-type cytochrome oxidase subunit 1
MAEKNKIAITEEEPVKDRHLSLQYFCTTLEVIGWMLIFLGIMWFIYSMSGGLSRPSEYTNINDITKILTVISWFTFDFAFIGLIAVILAHLTRYIFNRYIHKSFLLRCSDKILYLFAVFTVCWAIFRWFYFLKTIEDFYWRRLLVEPLIFPTVAKVLILVCIGQILKRILPIIEEYKSLV